MKRFIEPKIFSHTMAYLRFVINSEYGAILWRVSVYEVANDFNVSKVSRFEHVSGVAVNDDEAMKQCFHKRISSVEQNMTDYLWVASSSRS